MNKLPVAPEAETAAEDGDADAWRLARHAHLVVFEARSGDQLLTIYDCGAAQKPPRAQLRGHLVRVQADRVIEETPTGYVVKLRERGRLVRQSRDPDHYVIRPATTS